MNILITGAGGFIGNRIARELLARKSLAFGSNRPVEISRLILADLAFSAVAREGFDAKVSIRECDLGSAQVVREILPPSPFAVIHLAAMVSGEGERDFDGCLRTNLDGTRALLEACRLTGDKPRVVFASSLAVFGGKDLAPVVGDATKQLPQTTYGMTKLIGELLVNEYSRKGFIDGRVARIPTIFVRPGRPNAAASSFASSVIREPLNGETCYLPVKRDQTVPLLGYRKLVNNLLALLQCDGDRLGDDRCITLPSIQVRLEEMIEVLHRVARTKRISLGPIVDRLDDNIMRIVKGWPTATAAQRALTLGLSADESVEGVILDYIEDYVTQDRYGTS